jgi:hypothetical protein
LKVKAATAPSASRLSVSGHSIRVQLVGDPGGGRGASPSAEAVCPFPEIPSCGREDARGASAEAASVEEEGASDMGAATRGGGGQRPVLCPFVPSGRRRPRLPACDKPKGPGAVRDEPPLRSEQQHSRAKNALVRASGKAGKPPFGPPSRGFWTTAPTASARTTRMGGSAGRGVRAARATGSASPITSVSPERAGRERLGPRRGTGRARGAHRAAGPPLQELPAPLPSLERRINVCPSSVCARRIHRCP